MLSETEFYDKYNDVMYPVHSFMQSYKNNIHDIKEADFPSKQEYKEYIMPINYDVGFLQLDLYDEEYRYYFGKSHSINNYNINMINELIPLIIGPSISTFVKFMIFAAAFTPPKLEDLADELFANCFFIIFSSSIIAEG